MLFFDWYVFWYNGYQRHKFPYLNVNHHFCYIQEFMIHDFNGFEKFSWNIFKIGCHPLNSVQGIFLEIQKVKYLYPKKHMKDLKLQWFQSLKQLSFSFSTKPQMSWRNAFAKTHWRIILVMNAHLEQGKIIHL